MSSFLYSFLVCLYFTLFFSCFEASNSQIAIDNFQGLGFLEQTGNSCGTPIECYMKAIDSVDKMKAEMRGELKNTVEMLEKNKAEMKEDLKNNVEMLEKNKAEILLLKNKVEMLEKNKAKSIFLTPSNWDYSYSSTSPIILIDYSFTLDVPSTVNASAVGHGQSEVTSEGEHFYIGFDGKDQETFGEGYMNSGNIWNSMATQNNAELGIGSHNVKLYARSTSGKHVMLHGAAMTLRIFPN